MTPDILANNGRNGLGLKEFEDKYTGYMMDMRKDNDEMANDNSYTLFDDSL